MRIITRLTAEMPSMRLFATVTLLILPSIAVADPIGVRVQNAWSRGIPAGGTGAVYLTLIDNGRADTLSGVSSAATARTELHESIDNHGVMKTPSVSGLNVAPGNPLTSGDHLPLAGRKHLLIAGTASPVMRIFAHAGRITTVPGEQTLAAAMPDMDHRVMGNEMPVSDIGSK